MDNYVGPDKVGTARAHLAHACFKCADLGHISRNCPKRNPPGQGGNRRPQVNNIELTDATAESGEAVREYSDSHGESETSNAYSGAAVTKAIAGYNAWHNVPTTPRAPARGNTSGQSLGPQGSGRKC